MSADIPNGESLTVLTIGHSTRPIVAREIPVEHIMSETKRNPHRLAAFAKRTGFKITYPPEPTQPELL